MGSFEEWIEQIRLFFVDQFEQHLYLGSPDNPRSTMAIINGSQIANAIRNPPMNLSNLESRYSNINNFQLHPNADILLKMMGLVSVDINIITDNDPISISDTGINLKFWSEFDQRNDINILPITRDLLNMMFLGTSSEEFILFIQLLAETNRSNRQKLLNRLVLLGSETTHTLCYYLFQYRDELALAIIREYGRHGIHQPYICNQAKNWISYGDKGYNRFAMFYLIQFSPIYLQDQEIYKTRLYTLAKFMTHLPSTRMKKVIQNLRKSTRADAFTYLETLSQDPDQFLLELRYLLPSIKGRSVYPEELNPALIDLLQYAEVTNSPPVAALVLAIASLFDRIHMREELTLYTQLSYKFFYVSSRLKSLILTWITLNRTDLLTDFLKSFFVCIPTLKTDFEVTIVNFFEWIEIHPILRLLADQVRDMIDKEEDIIEIGFHSSFVENRMIDIIVRNYVSKNNITTEIKFEIILTLVGKFSELIEFQSRPPKIITDNEIPHLIPNADLLQVVTNAEIGLSPNLFIKIFNSILKLGMDKIGIIGPYMTMIAKNQKELLDEYFDIILDVVDSRFDPEIENDAVDYLVLHLVIPWPQITGLFVGDKTQQAIDSYKILYQDRLESFDLESSRTLDIGTITRCYKLTKGKIPKFVESNIQFSFTKPVWDQLARHYLALGIERPQREAIMGSKLKEVPSYLLRDVLGQIALVNQTLNFCERNGFRKSLENLIINNMYRRGWNVERGMERTLPALFGSSSPRLRSYLTGYLVIDQGEISLDLLQWARDIENFALRDRIVRELERYGTPEMWVVLANSYHYDLRERSLVQLKESRMSTSERSKIIVDLLESNQPDCRMLGRTWLFEQGIQHEHLVRLFYNNFRDNHQVIVTYLVQNRSHLGDEHQKPIYDFITRQIWQIKSSLSFIDKISQLLPSLTDVDLLSRLENQILNLAETRSNIKVKSAISLLAQLQVKI